MADPKKITELNGISDDEVAENDLFVIVDVDDPTMSASGTSKRIEAREAARVSTRLGRGELFVVNPDDRPGDFEQGEEFGATRMGVMYAETQDDRPTQSDFFSDANAIYIEFDALDPPTVATFYQNFGTRQRYHNLPNGPTLNDMSVVTPDYIIDDGSVWYNYYLDGTGPEILWVDESGTGAGTWGQWTPDSTVAVDVGPPINGVTDGATNGLYRDSDTDDIYACTDPDANFWNILCNPSGLFAGESVPRVKLSTGDPTNGLTDVVAVTGNTGDWYIERLALLSSGLAVIWYCQDGGPPSQWVTAENLDNPGFAGYDVVPPPAGTAGSPTGYGPGSLICVIYWGDDLNGGIWFINKGTASVPDWVQAVGQFGFND